MSRLAVWQGGRKFVDKLVMIPEKFIEEIQARVDIVDLVSGYLPLKKTGSNFKACCPFHSEKTPSFVVSPQKQIFHCFGCGQGGGLFQFLMQMEKVNFPEAVEMLAKKLGMNIPYQKSRDTNLKNSCFDALEAAAGFYQRILKSKEQAAVLGYLKKRGIGEKTIDTFGLGFAPGRNSLLNYLRKKGFPLSVLDKASLVSSSGGGFRDVFCDRVVFPIHDVRERVIAFGGRTWQEGGKAPKYINSGESLIYSKRKALFGLNLAKKEIIKEGFVFIVEGYLDMVTPFMRGVKNITASLGTSLTNEQIKLISRFCSKVVLVFDSDNAGEAAMFRTIDSVLDNQMQVEVVDLPAGQDPDSIVRNKGKDYFLSLLNKPCGFFDYKMKVLKKKFNPQNIEDKSRIAESMLATLNRIDDQVKKYQYLSRLAQELKVKEEAVISEYKRKFSAGAGFKNSRKPVDNRAALSEAASVTEKVLIKSIFTNPKVFSLVKKNFKAGDFTHPLAQKAVSFLFSRHSLETNFSPRELLASIDEAAVSGFVSRIILEEGIPQDEESLKKSLIKLRRKHILEKKEKLKNQIEQVDAQGDKAKLEELIALYKQANSEVNDE